MSNMLCLIISNADLQRMWKKEHNKDCISLTSEKKSEIPSTGQICDFMIQDEAGLKS